MQPYYEDDLVTLYHGDSREVLPQLVNSSATTIITDPPYGLNIAYGRSARTIQGDEDKELLRWVWGEADRLLQADGWSAVFTDWRGLGVCTSAAAAQGLTVVTAGVWDKVALGMGGSFRPQYEMVVLAAKGSPSTPYNGGNIWRIPRSSLTPEHPHAKPLTLMRRLVSWLCVPGGLIVDPFVGSGTTLRAAKDCSVRAIGIEVEERYCEMAVRRLGQEAFDFDSVELVSVPDSSNGSQIEWPAAEDIPF